MKLIFKTSKLLMEMQLIHISNMLLNTFVIGSMLKNIQIVNYKLMKKTIIFKNQKIINYEITANILD